MATTNKTFTAGELMGCVIGLDAMLDMQPDRCTGMSAEQVVNYYASREVFAELEEDLGVGFRTYEENLQLVAACKNTLLSVAHHHGHN